ncbi:MAG: glutamine synthetase [Candidatus Mesenet longicola]|uniref:Glutamine synthetase n=1 Tax=Candidatus Mesenet longicola TaxID=1892558 RepID=A0A8J3HPL7_9RICK|nr:MAG: glutamine synthetase [Candidatus Mesenet longicola]GHM59338.1 MAG: glutamine synthetase [Candidatus Mesenet longicola]
MLGELLEYINKRLGLFPVFGIELEFYVEEVDQRKIDLLFTKVSENMNVSFNKEISEHQYELKTSTYSKLKILVQHLNLAKEIIFERISSLKGKVSFEAKPYINKAGSALNVHISLLDFNNCNVFADLDSQQKNYFLYSVGGLCALMKKHMLCFAPNDSSYLRYKYPDINTPTTVSWGGNNRTTAIRLPYTAGDKQKYRLEHRVPGADSDGESVFTALLKGIIYGIEEKVNPPFKVYGIASDPQYSMDKLPLSINEAMLSA